MSHAFSKTELVWILFTIRRALNKPVTLSFRFPHVVNVRTESIANCFKVLQKGLPFQTVVELLLLSSPIHTSATRELSQKILTGNRQCIISSFPDRGNQQINVSRVTSRVHSVLFNSLFSQANEPQLLKAMRWNSQ